MPLETLANYAGPPLPKRVQSFLSLLEGHSLQIVPTGSAGKSIRILSQDKNLGYVNSTVLQRGALVGYRFNETGYESDSCPKAAEPTLIADFCARYNCTPKDLDSHYGAGKNTGRLFLLIRDPTVALRVFQIGSGQISDSDLCVTEGAERFIEGKLKDVVMRRRERDPAARAACLAKYGYSCYACGTNLRQRYAGLLVEVIHVHHEEPLSEAKAQRVFDPVATMKPLCPNCHCVEHSRNPPYSINELRRMIQNET